MEENTRKKTALKSYKPDRSRFFRPLRWVFYKLCRTVSFPFAVSLITSFGGFLIAAQIAFFILATVDFRSTGTGDEFNRLFEILVLFIYAPGYYIHFGLLHPVKILRFFSPFGRGLKNLSVYTTGYNLKRNIPEHIQVEVLRAVEKLPMQNMVAAFIYPSIVLIGVSVQEFRIGSLKNSVTLFTSILSAILVYSFFTYVIAEIITGGTRSRIKRTLILRRIPFSENYSFSIRFKYFFIGVFVFVSFIQLWYMMAFGVEKGIIMPLLFIITTIIILFGTFGLYLTSIQSALNEIQAAAYNLSSGGRGKLYSRSLDREIIDLSRGIVAMAYEVNDHRENLERKVEERTNELKEALDQVNALKKQQDGDYYLTSLLCRPLFNDFNKSEVVSTAFIIKQKKSFNFRNREGELGGDICVTGNITLGDNGQNRNFTFVVNGDAMGKSMQGAGGSLVMGVVLNSILERHEEVVVEKMPEDWLTEVYEEIHAVFRGFNGTMVISCVMGLVDEETGVFYYFNAEHPFIALYRGGKADFIENELKLRKLGLESEIPFEVYTYQLEPNDILMIGSDGKDDIDLTPGEPYKTLNEDETLFLKFIEESDANLDQIMEKISSTGDITDDLSILRIGFQESEVSVMEHRLPEETFSAGEVAGHEETVRELFEESRQMIRSGETERALGALMEAHKIDPDNMTVNKVLGLMSFKSHDYSQAAAILEKYLAMDPGLKEFWYYLSIARKKTGLLDEAFEAAMKLFGMDQEDIKNIINIADIYRLREETENAREFAEKALSIDPDNSNARRLLERIEED